MLPLLSEHKTAKRGIIMQLITVLVLALIAIILFQMAQMILTGRANKASDRDPQTVEIHRQYARRLAWTTAALVLAIETGVRMKGGSKHDALFWSHAFFALIYIVTLAMLFKYTGYKSSYHRWIAYTNQVSFMGVAMLGVPMMLRRF